MPSMQKLIWKWNLIFAVAFFPRLFPLSAASLVHGDLQELSQKSSISKMDWNHFWEVVSHLDRFVSVWTVPSTAVSTVHDHWRSEAVAWWTETVYVCVCVCVGGDMAPFKSNSRACVAKLCCNDMTLDTTLYAGWRLYYNVVAMATCQMGQQWGPVWADPLPFWRLAKINSVDSQPDKSDLRLNWDLNQIYL